MKKAIFAAIAALLMGGAAFAQGEEETPAKFKLYGFIRNYSVIDTRAVKGGTHDLYFYMPEDRKLNADGDDLNAGLRWSSLALTTRLGLDVSGYKFGNIGVAGKVEADFYSLNGTAGSSTIAQLRLRQAYVAISRDGGHGEKIVLNVGQTWHPIAENMPHGTNLETGAPFNAFNRSPQATLRYTVGDFTFVDGLLFLSQYLPMDAEAGGKSVAPFKFGLPECYTGIIYKKGNWLLNGGITIVNSKPIRTVSEIDPITGKAAVDADGNPKTYKAYGLLCAPTGMLFAQYTKGLLQIRAKTVFATSGEHLNLLSGYGIKAYDAENHFFEYTPMRTSASFVSFQYGKKVQVMGLLGYMKQFGTAEDLMSAADLTAATGMTDNIWINTAAATNIQEAFRATPTIAWNFGKLTLSLEYDFTMARFGEGARDANGLYGSSHWIANHRIEQMVKFNF